MTNLKRQEVIGQLERISCQLGTMGESADLTGYAVRVLEQTRWIPVSEKLPEKNDRYIVTVRVPILNDYRLVDIVRYNKGWVREDDMFPFEVEAWMPLPEIFEEGKNE